MYICEVCILYTNFDIVLEGKKTGLSHPEDFVCLIFKIVSPALRDVFYIQDF